MSSNDFKLKMAMVKQNRSSRTDDMPVFNELRHGFQEMCERFAAQKLNSSLRSSIGNRVTFKQDIEATNEHRHQTNNKNTALHHHQLYDENVNRRNNQAHVDEQR